MFRRCDGIGRRAGLKIRSWRQGAGSTPATGTIKKKQGIRLASFLYATFDGSNPSSRRLDRALRLLKLQACRNSPAKQGSDPAA